MTNNLYNNITDAKYPLNHSNWKNKYQYLFKFDFRFIYGIIFNYLKHSTVYELYLKLNDNIKLII